MWTIILRLKIYSSKVVLEGPYIEKHELERCPLNGSLKNDA
jgi:hypothetical protein